LLTRVPPTARISALALHDALPISAAGRAGRDDVPRGVRADRVRRHDGRADHADAVVLRRHADGDAADDVPVGGAVPAARAAGVADRESTRLNSSHVKISYALLCLK